MHEPKVLQHKKQLPNSTYKAMRTHFRAMLSAENSHLELHSGSPKQLAFFCSKDEQSLESLQLANLVDGPQNLRVEVEGQLRNAPDGLMRNERRITNRRPEP